MLRRDQIRHVIFCVTLFVGLLLPSPFAFANSARDFLNTMQDSTLTPPQVPPDTTPKDTDMFDAESVEDAPPGVPVNQDFLATTQKIPHGKARVVIETPNTRFATVTVNGVFMGYTPIALDLPPTLAKPSSESLTPGGGITVVVSKKGYAAEAGVIDLVPDQQILWKIALQKDGGTAP